jgi:Mg-chelatase subunit ChlD
MDRSWARKRQIIVGAILFLLGVALSLGLYFQFFYVAPSCSDGIQNGEERGVDCGGACLRICAADVSTPVVKWARSFEIVTGQYNAVAYVENMNRQAGTPAIPYTFSLYDEAGLITERSGVTILPPGSIYPIFEGRISTGTRVPTRTFLELGDARDWLPAEAGREQFTILSRELSGIETSPRLVAQIANNTLGTLFDTEVVATIFDVRGNALTSSRTVVEQFDERETRQVVFTWPEPIAKTLRSCSVPTDIVMAIDLSGSMNNDGATPPEPITSVLAAADSFLGRARENDRAAIVTFASEAAVAMPFSTASAAQTAVRALGIDPAEERGNTNTGDAITEAAALFAGANNTGARQVLILLTDGLATAPTVDPEVYAKEAAGELMATGVEVYAIGLGQEVNMDFIREIASPDRAYQAVSRAQVDQIYRQITGAICEDGAAIIDIVPKTKTNFPTF